MHFADSSQQVAKAGDRGGERRRRGWNAERVRGQWTSTINERRARDARVLHVIRDFNLRVNRLRRFHVHSPAHASSPRCTILPRPYTPTSAPTSPPSPPSPPLPPSPPSPPSSSPRRCPPAPQVRVPPRCAHPRRHRGLRTVRYAPSAVTSAHRCRRRYRHLAQTHHSPEAAVRPVRYAASLLSKPDLTL